MKRLWKVIPPCYSDVHGFMAVINETDGMGLVDDPSRYNKVSAGGEGGREGHGGKGGHGGGHGGRGGRGHDRSASFGRSERISGMAGTAKEAPRSCDPSQHPPEGMRVTHTGIRDSDIIRGTESKVRTAFTEDTAYFHPSFVLLCKAPSSSMIGSDLGTIADDLNLENKIPVGSVDIDGEKDYLYGVSMTLEAMGKLLLAPAKTIPDTVNLLGCNPIDWSTETLESVKTLLHDEGYKVHTVWGMRETAERLRTGAAASVNLVVNVAGLRLAKYMQQEYGIPYVVGAPFGTAETERILSDLRVPETGTAMPSGSDTEPEVLIIGEQLTANAIRSAMRSHFWHGIRVLSFLEMDRSQMEAEDAKLNSEDQLAAQLKDLSVRLVIGDPDYRPLADRNIPWIDLPNPGSMFPLTQVARVDLTGDRLGPWIVQGQELALKELSEDRE
ncbi:MAG: hypothetical protein IJ206_04055 [Oscillospiraceae bacterium]|nr:hypothetical protein [Oscillospiraceae bacterium]